MRDYEISLWTHNDVYVGLLRGAVDFEGQAYGANFRKNVNGEETLSFSIPAVIFNKDTREFEDNYLWNYILNDHKVRLKKDKNKFDLNGNSLTTIHDFVIKNYTTSRDGKSKTINIECKSYATYELGKVGYSAKFTKDDLLNLGPTEKADIYYWVKRALQYTKNFHIDSVDFYESTRTYKVNDLTKYNLKLYVCKKESLGNEPIDVSDYWSIYREDMNLSGWFFEIKGKNNLSQLYENTMLNGYTSISTYSPTTTYSKDKIVYYATDAKSYISLVDGNIGNTPSSSPTYWKFVANGKGYEPTTITQVVKERIIEIERSSVFNIIQEIAEKFNVWPSFQYTYNSAGVITERKVIFIEEIVSNADYSINYGVNLQNISRDSSSDDIATKIMVDPVETGLEYGGMMLLSDAPQNLMMEEFIYNLDYYYDCGYITDSQITNAKYELPFKVRDYNLNMLQASSLKIPFELESNDLQARIDFYTAMQTGMQEASLKYANLANSSASITNFPSTTFLVKVIDNGASQYVDLSGRKGVIDDSNFVVKYTNGTTMTGYYKIYDTNSPLFLSGIKFPTVTGVDKVKIGFDFNPFYYYANAATYSNGLSVNAATIVSNLIGLNNAATASINTYDATINQNLVDKKILIDSFELQIPFAIKEGNWKDSEYKIREEFVAISPMNIATTNTAFSGTNGAYYITNGQTVGSKAVSLNEINFETIRVFKANASTQKILMEYRADRDFKLDYGYVSGAKALLIIPLGNSSFTLDMLPQSNEDSTFVNTPSVFIEFYNTPTGSFYSGTINKATGATVSTTERKYSLPYGNILESSINIYPVFGGEALVQDIDFQTQVKYDITNQNYYTDIILKPTRQAKFLTDTDNHYYKIELSKNITSSFYYNDAVEVANRSSKPIVSYSINAIDLSSLNNYNEFVPQVGQKILINDKELHFENEYGFLSEINYDLDNPENNQLTIANYKEKFEDLFQRIAASTAQITYREDTLDRVYDTLPQSGIIDPVSLQRSFDNNKFILSNSLKNDVLFNQTGITLTDTSASGSTPGQVRLVGNGIFLSNTIGANGERIWRTGITGDGINASEIKTGSLNTNLITIWDENSPRFKWDASGLFAYAEYANSSTDYTKYVKYNSDGILAMNGATKTFEINSNGNAFFGGNVQIGSGNTVFKADTNGIYLGNSDINSAPFHVFTNGTMYASTGTFSGSLSGGSISIPSTNPNFIVYTNGSMVANNAYLTGTIETNGGLNIHNGGLYVEGLSTFDDTITFKAFCAPDTTNVQQLGTTSLAWSAVYSYSYPAPSDFRLKTNIKEIENGVQFILNLKPVQFNYKEYDKDNLHYGFIAQEVEEIMNITNISSKFSGCITPEFDEYKAISYNEFISPAIQTIQYLNQKINDLENRIKILESK